MKQVQEEEISLAEMALQNRFKEMSQLFSAF